MEVSMKSLLLTSLYAVLLGVIIGIVYDVFRILRVLAGVTASSGGLKIKNRMSKLFPDVFSRQRGRVFSCVFTAVTDFVFILLFTIVFILFLYCFNYGKFRWFILVFTFVGFRLYYVSFGRVVISLSGLISDSVKLLLNAVLFVIMYPFRVLLQFFLYAARKTVIPFVTRIWTAIDKRRQKRYTFKCIGKINDIVNEWVDV